MAEQPNRIFFGSLEINELDRIEKIEAGIEVTSMETVERTPNETLPFSEKTSESIERQKKLLEELELQKKMREIPVPTNDDLVKARLVELHEPMILFGEGKPERRERLRRILAERGISQAMPSSITRARQQPPSEENQQEPFLVVGEYPNELKQCRLNILYNSLNAAKARLVEQRKKFAEMEDNWETHEIGFKSMFDRVAKYSEASSQIGDVRALSSVSFSPDGSLIATSAWTGLCKVWDLQNSQCKLVLKGHTERANHIVYYPQLSSPSTLNMVSGGADNKVILWSGDSEKPLRVLEGHVDRVNRVVFHPNGQLVASTSFDKTWSLWDLESGKDILVQGGNSRAVYGLAFHCDGALVATSGLDSVGRVWDLRSGRPIWNFRGHAKQVLALDFAPNGFQIASGSDDRTVRIWDLRKRKTSYIIPAHNHLITTVKYQPKYGNFITTSSYDKTSKVWGTKGYQLVKVFAGHEGKVTYVEASPVYEPGPEGYSAPTKFVSCSFDKTWKVWEYDPMGELAL